MTQLVSALSQRLSFITFYLDVRERHEKEKQDKDYFPIHLITLKKH